jgi:desulfoferrodoxin (superoxide reductase-like protein)
MFDHRRCLQVKHSPVPILMKECSESPISASLHRQDVARLVAEMHHIHWILLTVIHDFLIGVDLRRIHL